MKLSFTKMQGCANDYIYLDCRTSGVPEALFHRGGRHYLHLRTGHSRGRRHDAHL